MSGVTMHVTDEEFPATVIQSDLPVLVDFWAPWCGPCRLVGPVLDELAAEYEGRLRIAKVNTELDRARATEYAVRGIPTMILFKDGVEVDRMVGALSKPHLQRWIEQSVSN